MRLITLLLAFSLLVACGGSTDTQSITQTAADNKEATNTLTVYKSPTCGCCGGWVDHLDKAGFKTTTSDEQNMAAIKEKLGVDPRLQSCHTAQSGKYYFEGHIPISSLRKFLDEAPSDAKGLAVPAMPIGSLGMEDGDRFQPYKVWLVKTNDEIIEYASINSYQEQF